MSNDVIYHYKKNRKQRSWLFINMAVMCLLYIVGIYAAEHYYDVTFEDNFRPIYSLVFSISSVILLCVALWLRTHPATYEAVITAERFKVTYPDVEIWSFDVKIADIKRFETRYTLSSGGQSAGRTGVLLHDGSFHEICMNYGNSAGKMYKVIKSIKPDVTFPLKANKKVVGFLEKDYDN